jgi:hypothetical protein
MGDEGVMADRGAAGAAVVETLEEWPPLKNGFPGLVLCELGRNWEPGTIL